MYGLYQANKVRQADSDVKKLNDRVKLIEAAGEKVKAWPKEGTIEFNNASMRYRPTLEPSIKNLSFTVGAQMRVGIVGRTGAGKSSILQALFRLCDVCEGEILIDGVNIRSIGLHLLRKGIAYIPQSPFLMNGTIRKNLDPFNECTDEQVE